MSMASIHDGPSSSLFTPLPFHDTAGLSTLTGALPVGLPADMAAAREKAPVGSCVSWGIPFEIGPVIVLSDRPIAVEIGPVRARWLVFLHTSDLRPPEPGPGGIVSPMPGLGRLAEHAADYVVRYADGSEVRMAIRRRHQLSSYVRRWGENCFESVAHHKPFPIDIFPRLPGYGWGDVQVRASSADEGDWVNWLWAWENPSPEKEITGLRFEPATGIVVVSAVTAGNVASLPLRWRTRRKACLTLPAGESFRPQLNTDGLLEQVQLDLGQVISAVPRLVYPDDAWVESYDNQIPDVATGEVLVEYTAHPEAAFHLAGGQVISVAEVEQAGTDCPLQPVAPAEQTVTLRVVERGSSKPVPVKLHLHGEWGEYLAPVDRHRLINPNWFEDYGPEFAHIPGQRERTPIHSCTYIGGETTVKLPLGKVYVEVSKGFEIRPVHRVVEVTPATREVVIELDKVLPWREQGWVTADTHVHFLSPITAMLEGSAEGVNVINLLASQWGELMTNVGDFDGKNTWGSKEAGGDGEHLVRVGTENRQHVLGHISLLGYQGSIIAPMTVGGPDEAALGDPVEILLCEWARQCRRQGGLVVFPHFPNPRAEQAVAILNGDADAVEMTSWEDHYYGINPYSISDWYRYLNCGYLIPAVGGTDKMNSATAVGTVRTYARIDPNSAFDYESWKAAVRRGETFVTYGPLLEFLVDGKPMGNRIDITAPGGTVDVIWQVASVTVPVSRVDLVVNGEIRESAAVPSIGGSGQWSYKVDKSCWLALLVRGHQPGKPEVIAAHSSPVMVRVSGSPLLAAGDAVTILDQIEGAMVYLDTVGTRADERAYKRMRLELEAAYRALHNRMHQEGQYHEHGR